MAQQKLWILMHTNMEETKHTINAVCTPAGESGGRVMLSDEKPSQVPPCSCMMKNDWYKVTELKIEVPPTKPTTIQIV